MPPRTRIALAAVVAIVLALGVAPAAGAASGASGSAAKRQPKPQCGGVVAGINVEAPATPSRVRVVRVHRISCAAARRVVRRCMGARRVKGWRRIGFTNTLHNAGRRVVRVRIAFGPAPRCLMSRGFATPRRDGEFGPFEYPRSYSPRSAPLVYDWTTPVTTYNAKFSPWSISTVSLTGFGRNLRGEMRAFWFEYGKTRDLGTTTDKQNPSTSRDPIEFSARLDHLNAKTRYFWRAAASFDDDGAVKTAYGTVGSFVTKPYPKLENRARPCNSSAKASATINWFEVTESLAIVCTAPPLQTFTKGACFPACYNTFHGRLECPKVFPRNLNAGTWNLPIPKIGFSIAVNNLVSYWRSNNSNRFLPGGGPLNYNQNSDGAQLGPIPGWSKWDVMQWAYPATPTKTQAEFWINCTEQWGKVIAPEALAQGEGSDTPSTEPPSQPLNLTVSSAADGGLDVGWQAPSSPSATGLAGYYVSLIPWEPGKPRDFPNQLTPVTTTSPTDQGTDHIPPAMISAMQGVTPAGWELTVVVGAVSREGSISTPAIAPLP
jgi:hypothetical protein